MSDTVLRAPGGGPIDEPGEGRAVEEPCKACAVEEQGKACAVEEPPSGGLPEGPLARGLWPRGEAGAMVRARFERASPPWLQPRHATLSRSSR